MRPTGERILARERRHWIVLAPRFVIGCVAVAIIVAAVVGLRLDAWLAALAVLTVAFLFGLWLTAGLAAWTVNDLTLTDSRVVLRRGVLARRSKVIGLERIQDIATARGPLGRVLDYGLLEIEAAGSSGCEVIDKVRSPERVRDQVFSQTQLLRAGEPGRAAIS